MRGLLNVQFALQSDVLYVIEANPRASRTVPFVAKATGVALAKAASRVMLGATIAELRSGGVEVSDAKPVGPNRQAFLHDPAGNMVELQQPGAA